MITAFIALDDHSFYCTGRSQLFTALDDYNSLLPWVITAVYGIG